MVNKKATKLEAEKTLARKAKQEKMEKQKKKTKKAKVALEVAS